MRGSDRLPRKNPRLLEDLTRRYSAYLGLSLLRPIGLLAIAELRMGSWRSRRGQR